jgi:hypothetical protein
MRSVDSFLARCNALMEGKSPREILEQALSKLAEPHHWTQGARARDGQGAVVRPEDPTAVCWDIEGAIAVSCNRFGVLPPYFMVLLDSVAEDEFGYPYGASHFNEHYDHDSVLTLLRIAAIRTSG